MRELRLSSIRQYESAQVGKRRIASNGSDRSQSGELQTAVEYPHLGSGVSSENSSTNAWNWNYNNQNFNNNNKNNNNSVLFVRTTLVREDHAVSLDDLYYAYEDCRKRKKRKRGAKAFDPYLFHNLCNIRDEINQRRYKLRPSQCFVVKYPVPREVFCAAFRDRVVQHFIYRELNPCIERLIINDTASCRVGKGTDYAISRVERFVRRETNDYKDIDDVSYGKLDISGFFMSIDRQILLDKVLWVVDNVYRGRFWSVLHYLLPIVILSDVTINAKAISPLKDWDLIPPNKTLFGNSRGLPIGNITSQLFANFYLNDIDHFIKSRHKSYERYVDDKVIVDRNADKISETIRMVSVKLAEIGMRLNDRKSRVDKVRYGIDFLGVKIRPFYSVLGKKRINRLWYTSRFFRTVEDAYRSCASRKGMLRRYHGKRIAERWYMRLPESFRENLKMDTDATFHLIGDKALPNKNQKRSIRLYTDERRQTA